jgi:LysR family transcriptional regulator (chromosome initiation inhibitor)
MMRFPRDLLETLAVVVEAGTFDAAAQRLNVTPSAVSQRVKLLEQQLGRVLVVRSKPVRPTESGEALVRLARQLSLLENDAATALKLEGDAPDDDRAAFTSIPIAVNADSLATWILPALARVATERDIIVDLHREDQERTAGLLVAGTVMAAVTSRSHPIPGCTVTALGAMSYRPVAAAAFVARWFPDHVPGDLDAAALAVAPVVDFDRSDELQSRYLRAASVRSLTPPRHHVPASTEFAQAILLGMGWGMLPAAQADAAVASGALVDLDPAGAVEVPLYWQQWNLRSPALDAVAEAVISEARNALSGMTYTVRGG